MLQMHGKQVRHTLVRLTATALLGAIVSSSAFAQSTLNFGTAGGFGNLQCLSGTSTVNFANYGGFAFTGLRSAQPSQFTGGCAATNSGLTANASIMAIGGSAFTFQSARFADAFPSGATAITLSGFLGATQVFSNTVTLGSSVGAGLLFTNTSVGAIDRLTIMQTGNDPFLIDDFSTSAVVSTVTPEPSTWFLLAASLAILAPIAARRKRV